MMPLMVEGASAPLELSRGGSEPQPTVSLRPSPGGSYPTPFALSSSQPLFPYASRKETAECLLAPTTMLPLPRSLPVVRFCTTGILASTATKDYRPHISLHSMAALTDNAAELVQGISLCDENDFETPASQELLRHDQRNRGGESSVKSRG